MGNPINVTSSGIVPAVIGTNTGGGDGVLGGSDTGNGVVGMTNTGRGVSGSASATGAGVYGTSGTGYGVYGSSAANNGVHGESASAQHSAVCGINSNGGIGIRGQSSGNAGEFEGNVSVTGDVTATGKVTAADVVLTGADCAEEFDLLHGHEIEPGSVVVFGEGGELSTSALPYDKRVAGVISGAGAYRPGVILDRRASSEGRAPVALIGKVYCKVDATYAPIELGDSLTTSPTAGSAMKVSDPASAFGAVIGKALASHKDGPGLIPILVSRQ
jgi:hypothetical protein